MSLEGLPENVEAVRYGVAQEGEFVAWDGEIVPWHRIGKRPAVIVRPKPGYTLYFEERTNTYLVVHGFPAPKPLCAFFQTGCEDEQSDLIKRLGGIRGFVAAGPAGLYLAFCGSRFYPNEGLGDLIGIFAAEEEAVSACKDKMRVEEFMTTTDWAEVWSINPETKGFLKVRELGEDDLEA